MIRDVDYLDIKTMHKAGMTAVDIGLKIGYSDKKVRKWIKRDTPPRYTRKPRPSKLDPYKEYIMGRMAEGVFNCEVLIREIRSRGYEGGITISRSSCHLIVASSRWMRYAGSRPLRVSRARWIGVTLGPLIWMVRCAGCGVSLW